MYFNSIISDSTKLLKPILVFAFAIAAGVCGLTQITQYRSHPADVYVGFLIGSGIAAYLVGAGPCPRGSGGKGGGRRAVLTPRSPSRRLTTPLATSVPRWRGCRRRRRPRTRCGH